MVRCSVTSSILSRSYEYALLSSAPGKLRATIFAQTLVAEGRSQTPLFRGHFGRHRALFKLRDAVTNLLESRNAPGRTSEPC
jgi:hypothetical protein